MSLVETQSKPQRTNGRKAGTPNKVTAQLRTAAREFSKEALDTLVDLMRYGESGEIKIRACNAILDRAHGKPAQAVRVMNDEEAADTFADNLAIVFKKADGQVIDVTPRVVVPEEKPESVEIVTLHANRGS